MPSESVEPLFIPADTVRPGDVIRWCDRSITVVSVEPISGPYGRRPAVYLTAESSDVSRRRLHYWAHENVELADA